MKTTIVKGVGTFKFVRRFYGAKKWVPSCDLCDLKDSLRCDGVFCCRYDTENSSCHLKLISVELAQPESAQNTPSEARRKAGGK